MRAARDRRHTLLFTGLVVNLFNPEVGATGRAGDFALPTARAQCSVPTTIPALRGARMNDLFSARRPLRPRHRRFARHRPHDRGRLPQGRRPRLHLGAQGRGLRQDRGRAVVARPLRVAAGGRVDERGHRRAGGRLREARAGARHPRQQRRGGLGRDVRHVPGKRLGQGRRPEPEDAVLPDAGADRAAAQVRREDDRPR